MFKTVLATLGILLGFSNAVVAQYGAPEHFYREQINTPKLNERLVPVYKNKETFEVSNCLFIQPTKKDTLILMSSRDTVALPITNLTPSDSDSIRQPPLLPTQIIVYPNPSDGIFTLSWTAGLTNEITILIQNYNGQLLLSEKIMQYKGINNKQYNIKRFVPGIYLLQILSATEVKSIRIVKKQ